MGSDGQKKTGDLVREAVRGSKRALEDIIRRIQQPVYSLSLRMLFNPEDAKDAAQEILITVITNLRGYRHEGSFDIKCSGCLSDNLFMHCKQCDIRDCIKAKGYEGCHQCDDFPCRYIENFPMAVGKKVILRSVPYRRKYGTKKWVEDEKARYFCPECGNKVFRGVVRCNKCKASLDLD